MTRMSESEAPEVQLGHVYQRIGIRLGLLDTDRSEGLQ